MPNHITNILHIEAPKGSKYAVKQKIKEIQEFTEGKTAFDFEKIIPMPPEVFRGDLGSDDEAKYPGTKNWYGWSIAFWGTKWNAYEVEKTEDGFKFDTAWGTPLPIFIALSKHFPDVHFFIEYADEDIGSNCGTITLLKGEVTADISKQNDIEFACRIKGYDYNEYKQQSEI